MQHESDRAFMALGNVIQHHKQVLDNLQVQFDQVNDKHPDVRERLAGQPLIATRRGAGARRSWYTPEACVDAPDRRLPLRARDARADARCQPGQR